MNNLAIIPARGGSKSIPMKNIVDLGGKTLIAHTIITCKKSKYVNRVIVTTDSPEIAAVAKEWGAEAPFLRPAELAGDTVSTIPVVEHALRWLEEKESYRPDNVLMIQPTEPFIRIEDVNSLFELVLSKSADSGISIVESPRMFHPYHVRYLTSDGYLEFDNPELHYKYPSRQLDPKRYAFGGIYWFKRDAFLAEKKIEVGKRVGLPIDPISSHDINTPADLEIARYLVKKLKNNEE